MYRVQSSGTKEDIEQLLDGCRRIGLEFSNYLLEYFAETPDDDERIAQTESILHAIYDSHAKPLTPMLRQELDVIWDEAALMDSIRKTYEQIPETAFIHIMQEHIQKKLEEIIRIAIS